MIKYKFLKYTYSASLNYVMSLKDVYELVIDPTYISYFHKYNVVQHSKNTGFQNVKIFYNTKNNRIEYASFILKKNEIKTEI